MSQQAESRIRFEFGLDFHDGLIGARCHRSVIHIHQRLHEAGRR